MVFGGIVTRIALAAALICAGLLWLQTQRLDRVQAVARDQAAEIEGYREAAKIHAAYAARRDELARQNADLARELADMDGRDAPLSDHLRAAAGRVWSTD